MGNVSIKVKLKPEPGADGQHVIRLHITKDRMVRKWQTSMSVQPKQFNPSGKKDLKNWIRKSHYDHQLYNDRILTAYQQAEAAVANQEKTGRPFSADDVLARLRSGSNAENLLGFYAGYLTRRRLLAGKDLGKIKTCDGLESSLKVFRHYVRETYRINSETVTDADLDKMPRLILRSLTRKMMENIKAWMEGHYSDNSIATYFSNLRTVLYAAVEDKIISLDDFPLRNFTISHTRKKVSRLREADIDLLTETEPVKKYKGGHPAVTDPVYAKPFALAIYYAHGARVKDMLLMRRHHYIIEGGQHRLVYTTGKNDKELSVLFDEVAIALFQSCLTKPDGTPKKPTDFLFPYLPGGFDQLSANEQYLQLRRASNRVRGQLTRLSERVGLDKHITPHIMRHSFADMLRRNGIPLDVRQMALGHSDIRTTRDYEEQFDKEAVDRIAGLFKKGSTAGQQNSQSLTLTDGQLPAETELTE